MSDGCGKQQQVTADLQGVAAGAITVELESKKIEDFDEYMFVLQKITPETPGLETIGRSLPGVCTGTAVKKEPQVEPGFVIKTLTQQ